MKKSHIYPATFGKADYYQEVHFDISGPLKPSLGGNVFVAHLIDPNTGKSDVFFLKSKLELMDIVQNYIALI